MQPHGRYVPLVAWVEATVVQRRVWAPGLVTLTFEASIRPFKPGQFVNLGLDIDGARVRRSYSLSSAPDAPLEVFLTEVPEGELTPTLAALAPSDRLFVEDQPQGFFTMEYVPTARDLWMIATGTGLGPFISMLRASVARERFDQIVVVHGVRRVEHLAYRDELEGMAGVRYVPTATREDGVLRGRIPALIKNGELERCAELKLTDQHSHVMLCGNPQMIADTSAILAERDMRRHRVRKPGHISTEKYW